MSRVGLVAGALAIAGLLGGGLLALWGLPLVLDRWQPAAGDPTVRALVVIIGSFLTAVVGQRPTEEEVARRAGASEELPEADSTAPVSRGQATTRDSLGLSLVALTPQIARGLGVTGNVRGVVVANVNPSSDAAQRGIQRGQVILQINGRPTATPEEAAAVVDEARRAGRGAVRLLVQRGNAQPQYVGVELLPR